MKKILIIILIVAVVAVGAVFAINSTMRYKEEDFKNILVAYGKDYFGGHKELYGWSDIEVDVDLSSVTVERQRNIMNNSCWLDGEVTYLLNVKEINEAFEGEEFTRELARDMGTISFSYTYLHTPQYGGYQNCPVNVVFVDDEGNILSADYWYDGSYQIYKNGDIVAEDGAAESFGLPEGKSCRKCGDTNVPLTSNRYCSLCVDIYLNEWYIALDGNVYVDKAY